MVRTGTFNLSGADCAPVTDRGETMAELPSLCLRRSRHSVASPKADRGRRKDGAFSILRRVKETSLTEYVLQPGDSNENRLTDYFQESSMARRIPDKAGN